MNLDFIPLLFAGDINVYSMARAFHEEYGVKSVVYGKYASGPCVGSQILEYRPVEEADQQDTFLRLVLEFASENSYSKILLIGCGDSYVQLISANKKAFPENVIAPYIDIDLMNRLIHKEHFYELCEASGVDYPSTFVHRKELGHDFYLPFEPPFIVKPSNGILYWQHPFAGQDKVFKCSSIEKLHEILDRIYLSGYDDTVIIQDFIPGDDTFMRVLTNYSDKEGKVRLMCLGHVLLEEHTPHGIGNHAVIITESNKAVEKQFKKFLEDMAYVGFSNFDIKYDQRDGKYKVFEINTRQGRSNYYVTNAGENLARYLVEDLICQRELPLKIVDTKSLWMVVPIGVALTYIKSSVYQKEIKLLIREGKMVNPLFYKEDFTPARWLRLKRSMLGHYYKYKKYLGK